VRRRPEVAAGADQVIERLADLLALR
jgi:hypothetical protein